jgi:hypothetical protein
MSHLDRPEIATQLRLAANLQPVLERRIPLMSAARSCLCALALAAGCGGPSGPGSFAPQGQLQSTDRQSGATVPWAGGGSASLVALASQHDVHAALGTAGVAADGTFRFDSLDQPPASLLADSGLTGPSAPECTPLATALPPIHTVALTFALSDGAGALVPVTVEAVQLLYSDSEATIVRTSICTSAPDRPSNQLDYNLHIVAGYNALDLHQVGDDPHHAAVATVPLPAPLKLIAPPL